VFLVNLLSVVYLYGKLSAFYIYIPRVHNGLVWTEVFSPTHGLDQAYVILRTQLAYDV
jgi:hypothetical protein